MVEEERDASRDIQQRAHRVELENRRKPKEALVYSSHLQICAEELEYPPPEVVVSAVVMPIREHAIVVKSYPRFIHTRVRQIRIHGI